MADEKYNDPGAGQQQEEPQERRRSRRIAVLVFVALFVAAALSLIFRKDGGFSEVTPDRLQTEIQELLIEHPTGFEIRLEKLSVNVPNTIVQEWFGTLPGADKVSGVRGGYDVLYHLASSWDWSRDTDGKTIVMIPAPEFVSASLRPGEFAFEPQGLTLDPLEEAGLKQMALQSLSVYIEQEESGLAKENRTAIREKVLEILTKAVPGSAEQVIISFPDEVTSDDGTAEQ